MMAKDGEDPVDDLFDAIQTVHDRRVKEETQTALLRRASPPPVKLPWVGIVVGASVLFLSSAAWLWSRMNQPSSPIPATTVAPTNGQPSTSSAWSDDRAPVLPAYQAPPTAAPSQAPSAAVLPRNVPEPEAVRAFQDEPHPSDIRPASRPQIPEDEEEDGPIAPVRPKSQGLPESEPEGFFE